MSIVTVFVGLDYHEDSVRVCVLNSEGRTLTNRNVANDTAAVAEVIRDFGLPKAVALEACGGAADFASELTRQTEWDVKLAHPGYVRRLKLSPDKSDHDDAELLADLVRVDYLPEVWLADKDTRQLRRLVCYRQQKQKSLKNLKLQIRSLLREERIQNAPANPWTKDWLAWAKELTSLSDAARWILNRQLQDLQKLTQDLKEVDKELERVTAEDPLTQQLLEQMGVGLVTAVTLRAEIGKVGRFHSGKHLARFCGLTPCNASSGKRQADAGLIRAGSPELRAVLIQVAHVISRHVPKWKALKDRLRQSKPGNVATVAVANRWMRWLFNQLKPPVEAAAECGGISRAALTARMNPDPMDASTGSSSLLC